MKRVCLKSLVFFATFAFGIYVVFLASNWDAALRVAEEDGYLRTQPISLSWANEAPSRLRNIIKPRFSPTFRGCGNGYVQGYEIDDGRSLSEGIQPITRKQFEKHLKDIEIIERFEGAKNRRGEVGVRLLAKSKDLDGKDLYEILWYGDGHLYFIDAPTLEIALEFERSDAYWAP